MKSGKNLISLFHQTNKMKKRFTVIHYVLFPGFGFEMFISHSTFRYCSYNIILQSHVLFVRGTLISLVHDFKEELPNFLMEFGSKKKCDSQKIDGKFLKVFKFLVKLLDFFLSCQLMGCGSKLFKFTPTFQKI